MTTALYWHSRCDDSRVFLRVGVGENKKPLSLIPGGQKAPTHSADRSKHSRLHSGLSLLESSRALESGAARAKRFFSLKRTTKREEKRRENDFSTSIALSGLFTRSRCASFESEERVRAPLFMPSLFFVKHERGRGRGRERTRARATHPLGTPGRCCSKRT